MKSLKVPVFALFTDGLIDNFGRYAVAMRSIKFAEGIIIDSGMSFIDSRQRYFDSCQQVLLRKFYRKLGAI